MSFSFLEQPRELVTNEQLVRLSIQDLLTTCKTDPQLNRICQGKDIWIARIRNEFPEVDVRDIDNPREFYLRQVLFGGQIYVHIVDYVSYMQQQRLVPAGLEEWRNILLSDAHAQTTNIPTEVIPYETLFTKIQELAETIKQTSLVPYLQEIAPIIGQDSLDYLIVYSRPSANVDRPTLTPIAYQDKDHIELVPGPPQKITLVDILFILPGTRAFLSLRVLKRFRDALDMITPANPIVIVNGIQADAHLLVDQIHEGFKEFNKDVRVAVSRFHREANTQFYQREVNFILGKQQTQALSPTLPRLNEIELTGNIQDRKKILLDFVLGSLTPARLQQATPNRPIAGFISYPDFVTFQTNYIASMDEEQLKTAEVLMAGLPTIVQHHLKNVFPGTSEERTLNVQGFVFDSRGDIAIIS